MTDPKMRQTRLKQLKNRYEELLIGIAKERDLRPDEWPQYELLVLVGEVNRERLRTGLGPLEVKDIERVEALACGHSDYAARLSRSCAELALGSSGGGKEVSGP